MAKALIHRKFEKEIRKAPPAIRDWAIAFVESIESQSAAQIEAKASKLRGDCGLWAMKKRRRPDGDYRLIFAIEKETVVLLGCLPRQDAYQKIPRRRGV